jgi:hypothetical protein
MRKYDLNIFYREAWDEVNKAAYHTNLLSIEVYIYESNEYGISNYATGLVFDCDEFETLEIAQQFAKKDHGLDWWVFLDNLIVPTRRIVRILEQLPDLDSLGELSPDVAMINKPVTMT